MSTVLRKANRWLLPAVLILFILQIVTFPFVLGITFADRSETPDHVLTYTPNRLRWDDDTNIDKDTGVAELNLFDAKYDGVESADGENIVAPGTEGLNIVRLKNNVGGPIDYTAVLYRIRTSEDLTVEPWLSVEDEDKVERVEEEDYEKLPLPEDVEAEHVITAIKGHVRGNLLQDFDISWLWDFERLDENSLLLDEADTLLGDKAATGDADEVTVGLYIVVEDYNDYSSDDDDDDDDKKKPVKTENGYIYPECPDTSDNSNVEMYLALMGISALLLILLYADRRREQRKQE